MICVCHEDIFCKKCYSHIYYLVNKSRISQYQKAKYAEKKGYTLDKVKCNNKKQPQFTIKYGTYVITWD